MHSRSFGALCGMILGSLVLFGTGCEPSASPEPPPPTVPAAADAAPDSTATPPPTRVAGERSLSERISDLSLAARIKQALARDRRLRGYDFEPEVEHGTVLLRGDVQTEAEYERAARIAARLPAVDAVTNAVTVVGEPVVASNSTGEATASGATHVVQPGETLWDIARSHRSSVDRIQEHNALNSGRLQPGQTLKIPSP